MMLGLLSLDDPANMQVAQRLGIQQVIPWSDLKSFSTHLLCLCSDQLPALVVFHNGKVVDALTGMIPPAELQTWLQGIAEVCHCIAGCNGFGTL
jgi:hypothetical protein